MGDQESINKMQANKMQANKKTQTKKNVIIYFPKTHKTKYCMATNVITNQICACNENTIQKRQKGKKQKNKQKKKRKRERNSKVK